MSTKCLLLLFLVTLATCDEPAPEAPQLTQDQIDARNTRWRQQLNDAKAADLRTVSSCCDQMNWHIAAYAATSAVANIDPLTGIAGDMAAILLWMQDCEGTYGPQVCPNNTQWLLIQAMKDVAVGVEKGLSYEKAAEAQLLLKIASKLMGLEEFKGLALEFGEKEATENWASWFSFFKQGKDFVSQLVSKVRSAMTKVEEDAGIELAEFVTRYEGTAAIEEVVHESIEHEGAGGVAARIADWIPFVGQIVGPITGAAFMTYTCHCVNDEFYDKYVNYVNGSYYDVIKATCPDALCDGDSIFLTNSNGQNMGIQDGHFWQSKNRGNWERWYMCRVTQGGDRRIHHGDKVFLRSDNGGQNLGVDKQGNLWMSNDADTWQTFIVQKQYAFAGQEMDSVIYDGDQIYLTCMNGQHHEGDWKEHIGVDASGKFWTSENMQNWERFTVSKEHNDY